MPMAVDPTIKSRPVYQKFEPNSKAKQQIFIAQGNAVDQLENAFTNCHAPNKDFWVVSDQPDQPHSTANISKTFPTDDYAQGFMSLFEQVSINAHLSVAGIEESFLWDIYNLAMKAGFAKEQIHLLPPTTKQRRVFCTHCYTINANVSHTPTTCQGCQQLLLVRDHFSRVHAAYVGVSIDAEDPNESFQQEELT